jgi:hypothetical protein
LKNLALTVLKAMPCSTELYKVFNWLAKNKSQSTKDEEQAPLRGEFEMKSEAVVGVSLVETECEKSVVEVPPEQPDLTLWSAIQTTDFW